jgi:hypothetical protein
VISTSAEIVAGGTWDALASSSENHDNVRTVDVPSTDSYQVAVQPFGTDTLNQVSINGSAYKVRPSTGGWETTAPVRLPQGPATIRMLSGKIASVLLFHAGSITLPASAQRPSADAAHLAIPPTNLEQLNYFENFDPGWNASGGHTVLHYRSNGFINGYVGSWTLMDPVSFAFSPDYWLALGRFATGVALMLTIFALLGFRYRTFLLLRTRRLRQGIR